MRSDILSGLLACIALSTGLAGCAEAPEPHTPTAVASPAPEASMSVWLAHLGPEDKQHREAVLAIVNEGDAATQRAASQLLVASARTVMSPAWRDPARRLLQAANAASQLEPTPAQLEAQIDTYRQEQLVRLLGDMDRLAGREAVAYAFELAENDSENIKVRQAAMAFLVKHVDQRDPASRERGYAAWQRVSARAAEANAKPQRPVGNASAVVAGMRDGFRRCYNAGLREDPNMKGSLRITAKIGAQGEVLSVSPSGQGLSPTVVSCVAARVAEAVFAPPEGGGATIVIPVTFVSVDTKATPTQGPAP